MCNGLLIPIRRHFPTNLFRAVFEHFY
jgi:hypothetical protein